MSLRISTYVLIDHLGVITVSNLLGSKDLGLNV